MAVHTALSQTETTHTTPMVIKSCLLGNATTGCAGRVDAAATLASTPLWLRAMASVVAASSISPAKYADLTQGSLIVPPGGVVSLSYLTTAAVGIASITWVEVPVGINLQ